MAVASTTALLCESLMEKGSQSDPQTLDRCRELLLRWLSIAAVEMSERQFIAIALFLAPPLSTEFSELRRSVLSGASQEELELLERFKQPVIAWSYKAHSAFDSSEPYPDAGPNGFVARNFTKFYSSGIYNINTKVVRDADDNYCCERCDGPAGPVQAEFSGNYVGWDIGCVISIGMLDDYGSSMLNSHQTVLSENSDPEELRNLLSRDALLALFAPWALE
jgi:hypothetical protein